MYEKDIKNYFEAANQIVISEMYLNKLLSNDKIDISSIKNYNPGHLGASTSINFILANLYYYLNENKLSSKTVVGTGHAGASLLANLWLNGTLTKYNDRYPLNKEGLNNLINDFGKTIRTEINPEYPETIYDGGELGYSLGVAYGYSINSNVDIVPCIIGDGEAETGTLSASWQLAKTLKHNTKVLPIINLNGLKMGSESFLSRLSNEELNMYFSSLGYKVLIVDSLNNSIEDTIKNMQEALDKSSKEENPLIIFKSLKGYTVKGFEGKTSVHKNPLAGMSTLDKLKHIKDMLSEYKCNIFDIDGNVLPNFDNFKTVTTLENSISSKDIPLSIDDSIDKHLNKIVESDKGLIFSPDEIYSNLLKECGNNAFEMLNENLLLALYQGYIMAGNKGYYVAYEGFMPIVSSMVTQYYKYLKQKSLTNYASEKSALTFVLTSTCWENTYSHQNPDFVNTLLEKESSFYNVIYPKDKLDTIKYLEKLKNTKDVINVITYSKRHKKEYSDIDSKLEDIEVIVESDKPDIILAATGDYMLDIVMDSYKELASSGKNVKVIYVSKPQILSKTNKDGLDEELFSKYFDDNVPCIYTFCGYANTLKGLLFDRKIDCHVLGYNDEISTFGTIENCSELNGVSKCDIIKLSQDMIDNKRLIIGRKYGK